MSNQTGSETANRDAGSETMLDTWSCPACGHVNEIRDSCLRCGRDKTGSPRRGRDKYDLMWMRFTVFALCMLLAFGLALWGFLEAVMSHAANETCSLLLALAGLTIVFGFWFMLSGWERVPSEAITLAWITRRFPILQNSIVKRSLGVFALLFVIIGTVWGISAQPLNGRHMLIQHGLGKRHFADVGMSQANLRKGDLHGAILSGANLHMANLIFADLRRADLTGADLTGANLTGARYNNFTEWPLDYNPEEAGAQLDDSD